MSWQEILRWKTNLKQERREVNGILLEPATCPEGIIKHNLNKLNSVFYIFVGLAQGGKPFSGTSEYSYEFK